MACTPIKGRGFTGWICGPDHFVNLAPFGSNVWCEYHSDTGPAFFRSENSTAEIANPSRKTWKAFEAWMESIKVDADVRPQL